MISRLHISIHIQVTLCLHIRITYVYTSYVVSKKHISYLCLLRCETCGKKFGQKITLKNHMTIHDDVKPHLCDLCGKSFRQRTHLLNHKQRHGTNKKFPCSTCDYSFFTKGNILNKLSTCMEGNNCPSSVNLKSLVYKHNKTRKL